MGGSLSELWVHFTDCAQLWEHALFPAHHLRSQFKQVHADHKRARTIARGTVATGWKARTFPELSAVRGMNPRFTETRSHNRLNTTNQPILVHDIDARFWRVRSVVSIASVHVEVVDRLNVSPYSFSRIGTANLCFAWQRRAWCAARRGRRTRSRRRCRGHRGCPSLRMDGHRCPSRCSSASANWTTPPSSTSSHAFTARDR